MVSQPNSEQAVEEDDPVPKFTGVSYSFADLLPLATYVELEQATKKATLKMHCKEVVLQAWMI